MKIGNYRIEEVSAPFGYVVNDKYVNISVDTDTAFETDGDTNDAIITVEYSDAPAVGELTVEKKGEVLDGFKGGLLASSYEKEFVYREGSLAGAKFKVYAAEDIYTADNQKDADGNRIKYYSEGDLVTTLTTGKDGKATAKNLSLGQYRVVEVEAPYGYVLNPNEQKVTFTYVDDKTPVIKESLTFSDDRQKLDMSVTKLDAEDNTPIAGAVFGLYADEDIKNVAGKVIIEKGTLLEKATSDENGKIAFVKDYPFAKYVARELVKPAGYVTNEEAVNFDTKYQGQDVKAAVYNSEYKNTPTTFEFTKTDIQFTVEDTGKVQHVEMKDEVPTGSIVINKDGEFVTDTTLMKGYWYDFIFNFFKDSLAGVTFDVYAKEDIVSADGLDTVYHKAGDKVATIVTNDKGIARIDDLPLGKYYLVETKTIDGFVLDDTPIEADLSYIDQNTKVVFAGMDVTNERQKVQITVTKTDSETKEALEGAVFGLFAKEDIVNKDGKVIVKADTQIERTVTGKDGKVLDTLTTDKNGHAESKELPICTYNEDGSFKEDIHYTVVETKAADGYILDETAHDVTLRYDDNAPDVVVTTLKLINVPTEPKLPQTGDNANPLLYLGIGALALITGVGVGLRGRKKKNKQ
ncbi:SpaA isopeptide-forming pilin-related protein [Agathobacter rectalis]